MEGGGYQRTAPALSQCCLFRVVRTTTTIGADPIPRVMAGASDVYIRYGDVICLHTQFFDGKKENYGFLAADGIIEDSLRVSVPSNNPSAIHFPSNIRPCLFRIMPMDQFAAQAEYDEKQLELLSVDEDKPNDEHTKHYLKSLAESAEKEKKMNKLASARRIEDREVVVYGAMVQLQHLKTGKFVSIDVNKLASHEKDALHCHVTTDENQNCWLGIFPRYSRHSCAWSRIVCPSSLNVEA